MDTGKQNWWTYDFSTRYGLFGYKINLVFFHPHTDSKHRLGLSYSKSEGAKSITL